METEQQSESPGQVRFLSTRQKQNEIALIPYAQVQGQWTLDDKIVLSIARSSQEEGTFRRVFYEGKIRTPEDFLVAMKQSVNVPVFAFRGTEPIGFAWINGITGNRAFAHFCMLKSSWGTDAQNACRMFVDYWLSFRRGDMPLLDILLGVIADTNARAVKFAQRCGFVRLGTIPMALQNAYTGDMDGAVILYYSRFEHGRR